MLRSLRHYLRAQSQGHHATDLLEERGVERGIARRSSFKGRERAIVNQTNIGTVSKATLVLKANIRDIAHRVGWGWKMGGGGGYKKVPETMTIVMHGKLYKRTHDAASWRL